MLLICGDTNPADRDNIQSTPQREHVLATGAGFEQLRSPATIAQDMATCIRRAWSERRPIVLNMPVEIQWLDTEYTPRPWKAADQRLIVAESDDLDNAIGVIAAARRPMVLAGRGAIAPDAAAAIAGFAKRLEAPLATTLQAKELFAGEDAGIGIFGTLSQDFAVERIMEADCLICFGASLNEYTLSHSAFAKDKRIIHVDIDPAQFGRYVECDVYVLGDAGSTADLFTHWLDEAEIPGSGWTSEEFTAQVRAVPFGCTLPVPRADEAVDMPRAVRLLEETFAKDRVLVTDGGRFLGEIWKNFRVADPADFVITVAFGSIGLGMGHAIGAAVGRPDRKVVHFTGDGGFVLGGLAEFNTAVRHNLDLVTIVCNDAAYGAEHIQFRRKGMDPALSMFDWPDFGKVAEALGGKGFSVSTFGELDAALEAIREHRGPVLIDMKFDPDAMPEFP